MIQNNKIQAAEAVREMASPLVRQALDIVTGTLVRTGWTHDSALILPWAIYAVSRLDSHEIPVKLLAGIYGIEALLDQKRQRSN